MSRVLVVEDEPGIRQSLGINLRARRYDVDLAADGAEALALASRRPPDLVVLDLGLPDMDGTDVVVGLRGWTRVPILVLSARTGSEDKVSALDAGADDYVTKPFGMEELLARLRALLRRSAVGEADEPRVAFGTGPDEVVVDLAAGTVSRGGAPVRLTPTEHRLLAALVRHPGRLLTQRQLLQDVWGPAYGTEGNYLRQYVGQLRAKLEADPGRPRHLLTEPGMGYRFQP